MTNHVDSQINHLEDLLYSTIEKKQCHTAAQFLKDSSSQRRAPGSAHDDAQAIQARISALAPKDMVLVARTFNFMLLLINAVEDTISEQRICHEPASQDAKPLGKLIKRLTEETKVSKEHWLPYLKHWSQNALVMPVLTAHPTEIRRESVLHLLRLISDKIRTDHQTTIEIQPDSLECLIDTLWQTRLIRFSRLTVQDEIENALRYFKLTFGETMPALLREAELELTNDFNIPLEKGLPPILRLGSWIGGDRDGNPNVGADTLKEAIQKQFVSLSDYYAQQLISLGHELSISSQISRVSPELQTLADNSPDQTKHRNDEPYRLALSLIYARLCANATELGHTITPLPFEERPPYDGSAAFIADLEIIRTSLLENNSNSIASGRLQQLIYAIRIFGFHLASIDLRQNAAQHEAVVSEIFSLANLCPDYSQLSESEKCALIVKQLERLKPILSSHTKLSSSAQAELDIFHVVKDARKQYGDAIIEQIIISHSTSLSDLLEPMLLMNEVGLLHAANSKQSLLPPRIVPLFETITDLKAAPQILDQALQLPPVPRSALVQNGFIETMLGYSDSNKDGGYLSSQWMLYGIQENVLKVCKKHDVSVRFFHGRGGSIGRGGGPTEQSVLAQPSGLLSTQIRLTEQGEVISAKYGNPLVGKHNLQSLLHAALEGSLRAMHYDQQKNESTICDSYLESMDWLSQRALNAYKALVEDPGFITYFQSATPIQEIAELKIGSRPASRGNLNQLDDLRAIPWVFSWAQCRVFLPGWYGIGQALDDFLAGKSGKSPQEALEFLRQMAQEWPFFDLIISNTERVLAKADMSLAAQYASLVEDREIQTRILSSLQSEHERASSALKKIRDQPCLLATQPDLQLSLQRRLSYLNSINHLQVELLRKYRQMKQEKNDAGTNDDDIEMMRRGIFLSISGIAAGLRNTG